ncbi:hypothetical protein BDK51DRAFT_26319 [Blyttiomyces helicus]|uniref:Uncharacterized protein n=1 Tax=Blyttiomyces helicus TaxID=388810 RepID=A0A4P9W8K7_9FUNG|nr:hypothetical protein BDK51DRAFT_26319 [Blyttiomyces helicus]|eukprot:RKO87793.1 hypothetical protein BDK51DRAFT_26319 [Blyttiomyces helicus]
MQLRRDSPQHGVRDLAARGIVRARHNYHRQRDLVRPVRRHHERTAGLLCGAGFGYRVFLRGDMVRQQRPGEVTIVGATRTRTYGARVVRANYVRTWPVLGHTKGSGAPESRDRGQLSTESVVVGQFRQTRELEQPVFKRLLLALSAVLKIKDISDGWSDVLFQTCLRRAKECQRVCSGFLLSKTIVNIQNHESLSPRSLQQATSPPSILWIQGVNRNRTTSIVWARYQFDPQGGGNWGGGGK